MERFYFIVLAKVSRIGQDGLAKSVREQYLVEATSFTEAEEQVRSFHEEADFLPEECHITKIVKPKLVGVVLSNKENAVFYSVKAKFIEINEKTGAEKTTALHYMIQEESLEKALGAFKEYVRGLMADYVITSISELPIAEFIRAEDSDND